MPVNCLELEEGEIRTILSKILFEFPVKEIKVDMPHWVSSLEKEHWLRASLYTTIQQAAGKITRIREIESVVKAVSYTHLFWRPF